MFARVTLLKESADDAIRVTGERVIPVVLGLPGSRGGFFLVNRDEGRTLSLTLWEDRGALDASAAAIACAQSVRNTFQDPRCWTSVSTRSSSLRLPHRRFPARQCLGCSTVLASG